MLARPHRLPKEILRTVLRIGRRYTTPWFSLFVLPGTGTVSRVAIVVGSAIDKRATARNRLKRILRAGVASLLPRLVPPQDIVIFPKRSLLTKSSRDVTALLLSSSTPFGANV